MKKQAKKQQPKNQKPGKNKGKKYEKPLSLHDMDFDEIVELALKTKPKK